MHRFFIPPSWVQGNEVTITGPQARQMTRVLRLRPGDKVIVLDNSGWELEVRLESVDQPLVKGDVLHRRLAGREPRTNVSLYQGVLRKMRRDRFRVFDRRYRLSKIRKLAILVRVGRLWGFGTPGAG